MQLPCSMQTRQGVCCLLSVASQFMALVGVPFCPIGTAVLDSRAFFAHPEGHMWLLDIGTVTTEHMKDAADVYDRVMLKLGRPLVNSKGAQVCNMWPLCIALPVARPSTMSFILSCTRACLLILGTTHPTSSHYGFVAKLQVIRLLFASPLLYACPSGGPQAPHPGQQDEGQQRGCVGEC